MWQMYPEVHVYTLALTKTCSSERLLLPSGRWKTCWYHQPKAQEGSFLCLPKSFSSTDFVIQVPCLSSLLPADPACSVVWWHPHPLTPFMLPLDHPCSTHDVQPLLTQVVAICPPRKKSWFSLQFCVTFSPGFPWWFSAGRKHITHRAQTTGCWRM